MPEYEKLIAEQVAKVINQLNPSGGQVIVSVPALELVLTRFSETIHALYATALEGVMGEKPTANISLDTLPFWPWLWANPALERGDEQIVMAERRLRANYETAREPIPNQYALVLRWDLVTLMHKFWRFRARSGLLDDYVSRAEAAEARAERAEAALKAYHDLHKSVAADLNTAHQLRGGGASQWMREDDAELRRDFRAAGDKAAAALSVREEGEKGTYSTDIAAAGPSACAASETPWKSEEDWPPPSGVPTYDDALKLVLHFRKPSVSFIQRKLRIGYNKACDYIEIMEAKGIVSKSNRAGVRTMLAALDPDQVQS